jgi:hypothetical protein
MCCVAKLWCLVGLLLNAFSTYHILNLGILGCNPVLSWGVSAKLLCFGVFVCCHIQPLKLHSSGMGKWASKCLSIGRHSCICYTIIIIEKEIKGKERK